MLGFPAKPSFSLGVRPPARLRTLLSLLPWVVFLGLVASPAQGAQSSKFRPQQDLAGYEEAYLGEYASLYNFEPYEARSGRLVSREELAELKEAWKAERQRGAAAIEDIEADPTKGFLFRMDRRMARSRFFKNTELERVDTFAPYYVYVERPFKDRPGYAKASAGLLGPWIQAVGELFVESYVEEREGPPPPVALVILASEGRYRDYAKAIRSPGLYWTDAHYDPRLKLAITYRKSGSGGEARHLARRPILHELVHALVDAHSSAGMPPEAWFNEGLAEYLSYHLGPDVNSLRDKPADREAVKFVVGMTEPEFSKLFLLPVEDLAKLEDYGQVVSSMRQRMQAIGKSVPDEFSLQILYSQASLLMQFLHEGEGGKYRARITDYVRRSLKGKAGPKGLAVAFDGVDLPQLQVEFLRYVRDQFRSMYPEVQLETLGDPVAEIGVIAASAPAVFQPSTLLPDPDDPELRFARVLEQARGGAMGAAAAELEAWLAEGAGEMAERVTVELERMRGFVQHRERLMAQAQAKRKKIKLKLPQGNLLSFVTGLEGAVAKLDPSNRLGLTELDLEQVDPVQLAAMMADRSKYGLPPSWLTAYPYVLAQATEGKRKLFDKSAPSLLLKQHAESDYGPRLAQARAIAGLEGLAEQAERLGDGVPGELLFQAAVELLGRSGGIPAVQERRAAILNLCRHSLRSAFESQGLSDVLAGEVTESEGGVVRVVYDFQDPAQLNDFQVVDGGYPFAGRTAKLPSIQGTFAIHGGKLEVLGLACIRHVLELRPTLLEYTATIGEPQGGGVLFGVGFADDGYGSFGVCLNLGSLRVLDKRAAHTSQASGPVSTIILNQPYHLKVSLDGQTCTSDLDGRKAAKAVLGPRRSGSTLLYSGMDNNLAFERLVIEGVLSEASRASMRTSWVQQRMQQAGLAD